MQVKHFHDEEYDEACHICAKVELIVLPSMCMYHLIPISFPNIFAESIIHFPM